MCLYIYIVSGSMNAVHIMHTRIMYTHPPLNIHPYMNNYIYISMHAYIHAHYESMMHEQCCIYIY